MLGLIQNPVPIQVTPSQAVPITTPVQTPATTPAATTVPVAAPVVPSANFSQAPTVADVNRLMITPRMDGKIADEEWDPFSTDATNKSYLQWEPGVIYAAISGPSGHDMLLSLDLHADGWMVGNDNLEARVGTGADGKPTITVRQLDASNKAGPVWRDLPGFAQASEAAVSADGSQVTYEIRLVDPGLGLIPDKPSKIDARIDMIPSTDSPKDALMPRSLAEVHLTNTRSAALPAGVEYGVEHNNRSVALGDRMFIRLTFRSNPTVPLKKVDIRSEGLAKDATTQESVPFPGWDDKGRSFVDYGTKIEPASEVGYRVLRATVTAGDGTPAIVETSYRVAPDVDFELIRKTLKPDVHDRSLSLGFYLKSNVDRVAKGNVEITVPAPLKMVNGGDTHSFSITDSRGRLRDAVELFVPASASGSYPLVFKVTADGDTRTYTRFLTIQ